jgi:hypothetical protein
MLCPRCSSTQSDDVKFCKACGANLQAVRDVLANREPGSKFEWGNTWVAEMFMSAEAQELRKQEMERRLGITPTVKRYREIKAGVITSCAGIAVAIFLFVFMQGVAGHVDADDAEILRRIWVAGVIPFFVGLALIFNGLVVSKRLAEIQERERELKFPGGPGALEGQVNQRELRPGDANEFIPPGFSVTEQTTRHLSGVEQNPKQ